MHDNSYMEPHQLLYNMQIEHSIAGTINWILDEFVNSDQEICFKSSIIKKADAAVVIIDDLKHISTIEIIDHLKHISVIVIIDDLKHIGYCDNR